MKRNTLFYVAMAGLMTGCVGSATKQNGTGINETSSTSTTTTGATSTQTSSGQPGNTFDHPDESTIDPFQIMENEEQEGPPTISTRMHSCGKMKYATIGNVLADLGVDMTNKTSTSANQLYLNGASALGQPDYSNRIPEAVVLSTAGAVKLYDVFFAATPEIVAAMPTVARCAVGGQATNMFDSTGACTAAGVSCLTGSPAQQAQVDLCTNAVQSNSTDTVGSGTSQLTVGQVIAVASLLTAAHSCE